MIVMLLLIPMVMLTMTMTLGHDFYLLPLDEARLWGRGGGRMTSPLASSAGDETQTTEPIGLFSRCKGKPDRSSSRGRV